MQFDRKIKTTGSSELPSELHLFLKPKDPKSVTLGNTFSNERLSWIACEDKLVFITNASNDIWCKVNLSDYLSDPCVITCGEELVLADSFILLLGCETKLGGLLLFFQPYLRRMIRILEIDVGVSSICIIDQGESDNPILPDALLAMSGIVALGGIDGSLILADLFCSTLVKALAGEIDWRSSNWAWPSSVNKIQYLSRLTDTKQSLQQKIEECQETQDSLAILLNDNEGELIAPKLSQHYSGVTCLHYSPIAASLFVGYEVGVWQMWSILDLELLYSSKRDAGQGISVVGLSVMEPCDDPRHYLYLWVGHSRPLRSAYLHSSNHGAGSPLNSPQVLPGPPPAYQEPPFSLIYSLAFNKKSNINSYGLLYSAFYKCDDIFEMELIKELDNFASGRILSVNSLICANPHRKYNVDRDDDKEMLRVWSIVWECEFETLDDKMVYVTLFDLNQWYNKTPGRPEVTGPPVDSLPIQDTPYYATWYFPQYSVQDITLAIRVDPQSLTSLRFPNQLDVHYYPSNISYSCTKVGTMKVCHGKGLSIFDEIKSKLELQPAAVMSLPEPLMQACISIGVFPNFDDTSSIHSVTITSDIARRYLLTVCVENALRDVVLSCARYWFDSACTETSISLDFLVDFLWDLFTNYKEKLNELCVCLFNCSGSELNLSDNFRIKQLNEYMKVIKSIYSNLIKDYSTFKQIYIVKHRHLAIEITTFYVDLIIWFISHNILPEQSDNNLPETSLPYKYDMLRKVVAMRRMKSRRLLVDELIRRWISMEVDDWGYDLAHAYPPPSIQSVLRIALIAGIDPFIKHFFIIYFLQDIFDCLHYDKFDVNTEKIIQNYEANFGIREGHMRLILSYRDIDCKNFKDGVERLLHKSVMNCDFEDWEHRHIIMELHKRKEHSLAFRYLKGMKPPLGTTHDLKMEISLDIALGNVSSAYFLTKRNNQGRSILLKHFFQECVKMKRVQQIYPLPLDKFEEINFLDFLRSSNLNVANDLVLYYYLDRHRYPEAFCLYNLMKRSGQVGGQDANSKKRDMIMKSLESMFDSKLLLIQQSVWEAKNTQPPPGFLEEKWKPTSAYIKFDDSDPKRPLLKSSIKDLAFITVWQGQKLSKMREKAEQLVDQRDKKGDDGLSPLVENVQAVKSELGGYSKKRFGTELGGTSKKPKFTELSKAIAKTGVTEPVDTKDALDYSIVQEMISTPKVGQNKTPLRLTTTSGPTSILRMRSGKRDDVSSCDDSSSTTPRKTLKFTLPIAGDIEEPNKLNASRPLRLDDLSDDEDDEVTVELSTHAAEMNHVGKKSFNGNIENDQDANLISEEEESVGEDDKLIDTDSNISEEEIPHDNVAVTEKEMPERSVSLEDRLDQIKSQNRKLNSFMSQTLTSKQTRTTTQNSMAFTADAEYSFISSQSSEVDDNSRSKDLFLEKVVQNPEPPSHLDGKWVMENDCDQSFSQTNYDMVGDDSSSSNSMEKVYTSMHTPAPKLSTIFESVNENEELCEIRNNTANTQVEEIECEEENRESRREPEEDEKLVQECDYQYHHQEDFPKNFDSESEGTNDVDQDEIGKEDYISKERTDDSIIDKQNESDEDVICIDSDSNGGTSPHKPDSDLLGKYKSYSESEGEDSGSKSISSGSPDYSEDEELEEPYDQFIHTHQYEDNESGEEEMCEEEDEEQQESDTDHYDEEVNYESESSQSIDNQHSKSSLVEALEGHSNELLESNVGEIPAGEDMDIVGIVADKNPSLDSSVINREKSSAAQIDPSLLEKIVSFSKTVSEEQLKGLVDVVKSSIDVSNSKLVDKGKSETCVSSESALSANNSVLSPDEKCHPKTTHSELRQENSSILEVSLSKVSSSTENNSSGNKNQPTFTSEQDILTPVKHKSILADPLDEFEGSKTMSQPVINTASGQVCVVDIVLDSDEEEEEKQRISNTSMLPQTDSDTSRKQCSRTLNDENLTVLKAVELYPVEPGVKYISPSRNNFGKPFGTSNEADLDQSSIAETSMKTRSTALTETRSSACSLSDNEASPIVEIGEELSEPLAHVIEKLHSPDKTGFKSGKPIDKSNIANAEQKTITEILDKTSSALTETEISASSLTNIDASAIVEIGEEISQPQPPEIEKFHSPVKTSDKSDSVSFSGKPIDKSYITNTEQKTRTEIMDSTSSASSLTNIVASAIVEIGEEISQPQPPEIEKFPSPVKTSDKSESVSLSGNDSGKPIDKSYIANTEQKTITEIMDSTSSALTETESSASSLTNIDASAIVEIGEEISQPQPPEIEKFHNPVKTDVKSESVSSYGNDSGKSIHKSNLAKAEQKTITDMSLDESSSALTETGSSASSLTIIKDSPIVVVIEEITQPQTPKIEEVYSPLKAGVKSESVCPSENVSGKAIEKSDLAVVEQITITETAMDKTSSASSLSNIETNLIVEIEEDISQAHNCLKVPKVNTKDLSVDHIMPEDVKTDAHSETNVGIVNKVVTTLIIDPKVTKTVTESESTIVGAAVEPEPFVLEVPSKISIVSPLQPIINSEIIVDDNDDDDIIEIKPVTVASETKIEEPVITKTDLMESVVEIMPDNVKPDSTEVSSPSAVIEDGHNLVIETQTVESKVIAKVATCFESLNENDSTNAIKIDSTKHNSELQSSILDISCSKPGVIGISEFPSSKESVKEVRLTIPTDGNLSAIFTPNKKKLIGKQNESATSLKLIGVEKSSDITVPLVERITAGTDLSGIQETMPSEADLQIQLAQVPNKDLHVNLVPTLEVEVSLGKEAVTGKNDSCHTINSLDLQKESSSKCIEADTFVNSNDEHMVTVIAGNVLDSQSVEGTKPDIQCSVIDISSEISDGRDKSGSISSESVNVSLLNTAVCDELLNDSEMDEPHSLISDTSELNTAIIVGDQSFPIDLCTPCDKKHAPPIEMNNLYDDVRNYLDTSVNVAFEVSKIVKKKSKHHKKVEMVDKGTMTDKRRCSKRRSSVVPTSTKDVVEKEKVEYAQTNLVDRSMMTDKTTTNFLDGNNEIAHSSSSKRSRRRSSSLEPFTKPGSVKQLSKLYSGSLDTLVQPASCFNNVNDNHPSLHGTASQQTKDIKSDKPVRTIRKGIRRSIKHDRSQSHNDDSDSIKSASNADKINQEPTKSDGTVDPPLTEIKNHDKPTRKIRTAVRRKSSIMSKGDNSLNSIPEDKAVIANNDYNSNNSRSDRLARSSSLPPNMTSYHDKSGTVVKRNKNDHSNMLRIDSSKYSSNDELSTSSPNEGTPRRSSRLMRSSNSFNSPSSSDTLYDNNVSGKKFDFCEEANDVSTKFSRRSKLARRSTLADIVELPESDVEKSINSGNSPGHSGRQKGVSEANTKADLSLARRGRRISRRTYSSSSEPPMSENDSDIPAHWLRSCDKSDNFKASEDGVPHSANSNSHKVISQDIQSLPYQKRKSYSSKTIKKIEKGTSGENSLEESDNEHPPFSPLTVDSSPASPQSQVSESNNCKGKKSRKRQSIATMEDLSLQPGLRPQQLRGGRRRTVSTSSEPPCTSQHPPYKNNHLDPPLKTPTKKKSKDEKQMSGIDFLHDLESVDKRTRSLHAGFKIPPFKISNTLQTDGHESQNIKSLPGTSMSPLPELAAMMGEYSENRRLTRHQRSLIERSLENTPNTPESAVKTTPKRRRRSSVVQSSEDEALTPVRSSRRLQEKAHKLEG